MCCPLRRNASAFPVAVRRDIRARAFQQVVEPFEQICVFADPRPDGLGDARRQRHPARQTPKVRLLGRRDHTIGRCEHAGIAVDQDASAPGDPRQLHRNIRQGIEIHLEPRRVLRDNGHDIRISMDGKGSWRDNVFVERLWRSVKYEEVYLKAYETVSEVKVGLDNYLRFYNGRRPHSSLERQTPDQVYFNQLSTPRAAQPMAAVIHLSRINTV